MHHPHFTTDWFSDKIPMIQKHLEPYKGQSDICLLEIGTYEGRSAYWFLQNILTHETARLICIDPGMRLKPKRLEQLYKDAPQDKPETDEEMEGRIRHNLLDSPYGNKVEWIQNYSQNVLQKIPLHSIDIAYIDGQHNAAQVLLDTMLTWPTLKVGATIIFDDYTLTFQNSEGPGIAIDAFIRIFENNIKILEKGNQVIIQKIAL
jgi:hypothetical protein